MRAVHLRRLQLQRRHLPVCNMRVRQLPVHRLHVQHRQVPGSTRQGVLRQVA